MAADSFARPKGDPRRRVSDILYEHLEERLRFSRRLGIGLSATFMLLWLGTVFVAANYPAFFGSVAACR
jgi:hypothetical protein